MTPRVEARRAFYSLRIDLQMFPITGTNSVIHVHHFCVLLVGTLAARKGSQLIVWLIVVTLAVTFQSVPDLIRGKMSIIVLLFSL